jgi:hypothetical protein
MLYLLAVSKRERSSRRKKRPRAQRQGPSLAQPNKPTLSESLATRALSRSDVLWAAAIAVVAAAAYAVTLCRTFAAGDSVEFALVFARFGVAHAPGYALQSSISSALVHAASFVEPMLVANALSALWGAVAVGLAFLLLRRFALPAAASAFAALALASGRTFWSQAVVAEVYTFDLALFLFALHAAVTLTRGPTSRAALIAGLAAASWVVHRSVNLLYLPGLLIALSAFGRPPLRTLALPLGLGALLALVPIAYLPLAASRHPPIQFGDPTTFEGLVTHVTGGGFGHLLSFSSARASVRLAAFVRSLPLDTLLALPLAAIGAVALLRRGHAGRRFVGGLALVALASLVFAVCYEIPDIEAYFLPIAMVTCLLGGFGAGQIYQALTTGGRSHLSPFLAATGALGLLVSFSVNDRSDDRILRRMGEDILASVDRRALVFTHGDTVANILYYLQQVERRSPEVVVVYAPLEQRWYFEHLKRIYPKESWPSYEPGEGWESRVGRMLEALGGSRRAYFTSELDPEVVLDRGPLATAWRRSYELRPSGLVTAVAPRSASGPGGLDPLESLELLERAAHDLRGLSLDADVDSKITYLEYAYALNRIGRALETRGERELSLRAYRAVLELEPEAYERSYREEQGQRTGSPIPALGIEDVARAGVSRLARRRTGP